MEDGLGYQKSLKLTPSRRDASGSILVSTFYYVDSHSLVYGKPLRLPNSDTMGQKTFSNFSCMFLNLNNFFLDLNSNCSALLDLKNLQEQVKKHSGIKNYSVLSLFEQIVLEISKNLQFLGHSFEFQTFFSITRTFFSHSRSEQFW